MSSRRPRRRRAVTLVEMLTGLLITSMIALGVAAILHAASYGTSSRREVRRMVTRSQQLRTRINDSIRNARAVLASGDAAGGVKYLVLWRGDSNQVNKDQVNLSELQLIEWVPGSTTITSYEVSLTPNPDTSYDSATADFYDEADQARTSGDLVPTAWTTAASNFAVTLDNATPTAAILVTWSLTLTNELLSEEMVGNVSLRAHGAPQ